MNKHVFKTVMSTLVFVALLAALSGAPVYAAPATEAALAFTSSGQALRFSSQGLVVSDGRYALRVDFVGGNPASPRAADGGGAAAAGGLPELGRVTYANLWPGIDLAYDRGGGILRSTYTLAPGADPNLIRLRYNRAPQIAADGSLTIAFDDLALSESAPLAWQVIDGQRVVVDVAFKVLAGGEVGFRLGAYDPAYPLTIDPTLVWHTFLGGSVSDIGYDIAVDGSGNFYVAGRSSSTWGGGECTGCPIRAHFGSGNDAFVARLASDGSLTWNTFLGGSGIDCGYGIAVDGSGNVYATGYSSANWGSPMWPHYYNGGYDIFVVRLNGSTGALTWHAFLGGGGADYGYSVAVDGSGDVYVAGRSSSAWGTPVQSHAGGSYDGFAARLASNGSLSWNTFLGSNGSDDAQSIAVDGSGNAYVAGSSDADWGTPVRGYSSGNDGFAAQLNASTGALTWHAFLGGDGADYGYGITVDGSGAVYVSGNSDADWGTPVQSYNGGIYDAFAAKLDSSGGLTWNTFLGGGGTDYGEAIAVDGGGNVYVGGYSDATWGSPVRGYTFGNDGFAARLASNGGLTWNTFLGGSSGNDYGYGIALDGNGNVYLAGYSSRSWGSGAVRGYTSGNDGFVARVGCTTNSAASGSWGNTATWDTGSVPGSTDDVCVLDGHAVTLGAAAAADWLDVRPGGALDLDTYGFTVESGMFSDGVISQTQTVDGSISVEFLHIQNAGSTITQYRGLFINPNSQNLGAVSVGVRELNIGEYCPSTNSGSAAYARRCYEITPTTPPSANVQVRLYARTADELNGVVVGDLAAFRYVSGSGWVELTNRSTSTIGLYSYAQGDTPGFSGFLLGETGNGPTVVALSAFSAEWAGDEVVVTWETALEIDTVGFNLWRSTDGGAYEQVNASLIPAATPGGVMGGVYEFVDGDVTPGETYAYKLEELEIDGSRNWYGPVSTGGESPTAVALRALAAEQLAWLPVAAGLAVTAALGVIVVRRRRRT